MARYKKLLYPITGMLVMILIGALDHDIKYIAFGVSLIFFTSMVPMLIHIHKEKAEETTARAERSEERSYSQS